MPNFKQLDSEKKGQILALSGTAGMSTREIGKAVECSNATVNIILKKFAVAGHANRLKGSGAAR
jgi:transposase